MIYGFWSYTHRDNEADRGRITLLATHLITEFGLLTGQELVLFVDRSDLKWGDDWRQKIDQGLQRTTFFIPVLTPGYFKSLECRNELDKFTKQAEALGAKELVLPILWAPVPDLAIRNPEDLLIQVASRYQWEDWTDTRLHDWSSYIYRKGVNSLAKRFIDASRQQAASAHETQST